MAPKTKSVFINKNETDNSTQSASHTTSHRDVGEVARKMQELGYPTREIAQTIHQLFGISRARAEKTVLELRFS